MDVQACARLLRNASPPIDVLTKVNRSHVAAVDWDRDTYLSKRQPGPDRLRIVVSTLQPGEELIVGRRLREVLTRPIRRPLDLVADVPVSDPGYNFCVVVFAQ